MECFNKNREHISWPTKEELEKMVWQTPVDKISKNIGVSGVAIKKRCKKLGINTPPRGYWAKIYAEQSEKAA